MADESLTSLAQATYLIQHQVCNHFNLKISKLGGILRTLEIYQLAKEAGIPCQLGAHFGETSLLTAAGMLFASLTPNLISMEGGLGTHILERDIFENSLKIDRNGIISGEQITGVLGFGEVPVGAQMRLEQN